jgi:hypothetical protein
MLKRPRNYGLGDLTVDNYATHKHPKVRTWTECSVTKLWWVHQRRPARDLDHRFP